MAEKTLMQELIEAGYPREQMFNHESDLYIYATELAEKVVDKYYEDRGLGKSTLVSYFRSETDGRMMMDIAFQYDDYWKDKCGRRCEA